MSKRGHSEETAQNINADYGYFVTLLCITFIPGYLLGLTGSYRYSFVLAGTATSFSFFLPFFLFFFLSFFLLFILFYFLFIYYFIHRFR